MMKSQTKLTQVQGDQPIVELPAKTRISPLQRMTIELRVFTTYYTKYLVFNQKLLDKEVGKYDPSPRKITVNSIQPQVAQMLAEQSKD